MKRVLAIVLVVVMAISAVFTCFFFRSWNESRHDEGQNKSDDTSYFEGALRVIDVIDAKDSMNVETEKEVKQKLESKGFVDYPITFDGELNGELIAQSEVSYDSEDKHPVYITYYISDNDDIWTIYEINGKTMAYPVTYNAEVDSGTQLIISEEESVVSFDYETGKYYETIPNSSELIVKVVDEINADLLNHLTVEEISEL